MHMGATMRKIITSCVILIVAILGFAVLIDKGIPAMLDKLEHQRQVRLLRDCRLYGAAMNAFYGREVCETETTVAHTDY